MELEQLLEKGAIYFEKITQGFYDYEAKSLYLGQKEAASYLKGLMEENGQENSFVDFYYSYLDEEGQRRVLSGLDVEEQKLVLKLAHKAQGLFLPLDEPLLQVATKLIDMEMLFSTFYFTKQPCTVWGNYKQEYIKFTKKAE